MSLLPDELKEGHLTIHSRLCYGNSRQKPNINFIGFKRYPMQTYAGIDLHSSNNYVSVINEQDQRLCGKRMPNELNNVLIALEPFKQSLEAVVVESTFNWYWLVDGFRNTDTKCIWPIHRPQSNMWGWNIPLTFGTRFEWDRGNWLSWITYAYS